MILETPLSLIGKLGNADDDLAWSEFYQLSAPLVTDIGVVAALKSLRRLTLEDLAVTDISPLRRLTLEHLELVKTGVTDITALADMDQLKQLFLTDSPIEDLSPLAGCEALEIIGLPPKPNNVEILRQLPKLRLIDGIPVDIFWKNHFLKPNAAD